MKLGPTPEERAMKVREVFLRAMSGEYSWIQAAQVLGWSAQRVRRWRRRFEAHGMDGLMDRRHRPSPRRLSARVVQRVLRLYRDKYRGFNMRHFHAVLKREHRFAHSYSWLRCVLEQAGLVRKKRPRGRHRLRRAPRSMFGEMLHIDGSPHAWLALCPEERYAMITVVDDATRRLLYAWLEESESGHAILTALHATFLAYGLPMALYTDRAAWAAFTPVRGEPVDKSHVTQVGRALKRLGIEHILAYSPQARGRSERLNRTMQGRLVNELRVAGIRTRERANRYLNECFLPAYNEEFAIAPADPASAFVTPGCDLFQILCFEETRVVNKDNTVRWDKLPLQVPKQPGRKTCAGLTVTVRHHLDRTFSI
jgi:transposase